MTEAELEDEPGRGRKRQHSEKAIERIVEQTIYSIPEQAIHWGTGAMAKHAGVSHTTVGRIWHAHELKLISCAPSSSLGINGSW